MRKKSGILLGIALGLFGIAGYLVYDNLREYAGEKKREAARLAPRKADLDGRPVEFRNNILVREVMRQALFLAERDDRSLPTRDATLGEAAQDAREPVRGLIAHAFLRDLDGVQVQLFRDAAMAADGEPVPDVHPVPGTASRPILFQVLIPNVDRDKIDHVGLVERAERFSRGEFAAHLGTAAAAGPATPAAPATTTAAASAADVERWLGELNFISQYAAVRAGHDAIRRGGAKADAYAVLARGYANLGQLTAFHWTASSKAFYARALLYAQRMVVAAGDPAKPAPPLARALRHRAYALALAGLQGPALADLDRADQIEPVADAGARPGWLAVLRPFCRFRSGELAEVAAAGRPAAAADAPLALFLCFLTVERANSASVTNGYGQIALSANPDCLRVVDAMSAVSGVGANHVLTEAAPVMLAASIVRHLPGTPGLPQEVRAAVDAAVKADFSPASAARVPAALVAAGRADAGEPSWTVLGRLIQETQFVHVQRRAAFMAEAWGVDTSDFVREVRPLYAEHPYHALIEAYGRGRGNALRDADLYEAVAQNLRRGQPTFSCTPLLFKLHDAKVAVPDGMPSFFNWQGRFSDFTSNDLERYLTERNIRGNLLSYFTSELKHTSPHSPVYMAKMIENFWELSQRDLADWKANHGDHPTVAAALARKYTALKDWPEAERFLRAYIEKAPDQWAYHMLAANYLAQGDEARWLETLKARLEKPDYGLDHAQTNNVIARHYMERKKYAEALPYAEAGAASYAQWALETAAECHERLGHKEQAAAIRAAIAERYGR